jgi:oxygen-independent coproporphyrinogen-3 oxidase
LIHRARAAGITDLNIDLIYGLPKQTEASLAATIDHVVALAPDRIALFGYAHVPDLRPQQRLLEKRSRLPDRYERAGLLLGAAARLTAAGYRQIGLDHFTKPGSRLAQAADAGTLTRNFQGYSEKLAEAIIGLGASAISSTERAHWQNHADLDDWAAALEGGQLPVARGIALSFDDRVRGDVITELMCTGSVDLAAVGRRWNLEADRYFSDVLGELAADDALVHYDPERQHLEATDLGRILVRNVCMRFDRYLPVNGRRGSTTI